MEILGIFIMTAGYQFFNALLSHFDLILDCEYRPLSLTILIENATSRTFGSQDIFLVKNIFL